MSRLPKLSAKKSAAGNPLSTDFFFDTDNASISAVLYSWYYQDPFGRRDGSEFALVHNMNARAPLSEGGLPCGSEWARRGDFIERIDTRASAA